MNSQKTEDRTFAGAPLAILRRAKKVGEVTTSVCSTLDVARKLDGDLRGSAESDQLLEEWRRDALAPQGLVRRRRADECVQKEAPAPADACSCDTTIFSEKVSRAVADVLAAPGRAATGLRAAAANAAGPARPQGFL